MIGKGLKIIWIWRNTTYSETSDCCQFVRISKDRGQDTRGSEWSGEEAAHTVPVLNFSMCCKLPPTLEYSATSREFQGIASQFAASMRQDIPGPSDYTEGCDTSSQYFLPEGNHSRRAVSRKNQFVPWSGSACSHTNDGTAKAEGPAQSWELLKQPRHRAWKHSPRDCGPLVRLIWQRTFAKMRGQERKQQQNNIRLPSIQIHIQFEETNQRVVPSWNHYPWSLGALGSASSWQHKGWCDRLTSPILTLPHQTSGTLIIRDVTRWTCPAFTVWC